MLLLIGTYNNKKPILNNRVLIYIPNRKNSKRKWLDFLFVWVLFYSCSYLLMLQQ